MVFVLVFVVAMLVVPVMLDIDKHGRDNVLRRTGEDLLNLPWVIQVRGAVRAGMRTTNEILEIGLAAALFGGVVLLLVWIAWWLLSRIAGD